MEMTVTNWIQAIFIVVLVGVTAFYAWRTHVISKATKEQADAAKKQAEASIKMAEEMKEQRLSESQPYLLVRLEDSNIRWFQVEPNQPPPDDLTITVRNEGKGPAINIWAGLWHPSKTYVGDRKGYLAYGEEWQANIRKKSMLALKETLVLPELKEIIKKYDPEPIIVKCEDIHKRNWVSCVYFNWHPAFEGYVSVGEQNIMELKND